MHDSPLDCRRGIDSPTPDGLDDFNAVASGKYAGSVRAARDDGLVDLDGDPASGVAAAFQEFGNGWRIG